MTNFLNQLRDMSSLFMRSEAKRWQMQDFSSIDAKLSRYNLSARYRGNSYLAVLKDAYRKLSNYYPNEYVIKNEFLFRWLRDELGTERSVVFNEFRLGNAVADLAMFNGISKGFEIKSIFDNDSRLKVQLSEYKKIFNEVYLIVPKELISNYLKFDEDIGVLSYNSKEKAFSIERKADRRTEMDRASLMNVLHCKEYLSIVRTFFDGDLPKMNSFNQFEICKKLMSAIPDDDLNCLFIEHMKVRKLKQSTVCFNHREFNQLCLALNIGSVERSILLGKLSSSLIG